jgi:hypothetical protein
MENSITGGPKDIQITRGFGLGWSGLIFSFSTEGVGHMPSFERANEVRFARSEMRAKIARGEQSLVDLVMNPPDVLTNMPLFEVLMAQRNWGKKKVLRFLTSNGLSEWLGLQTMTQRQRKLVVDALTSTTWSPDGRPRQTG